MFIPDVYTVESVTKGHPDKVCDQIADAIREFIVARDPDTRTAIEVLGAHGKLYIAGEITTTVKDVDYAGIARATYRAIGYTDALDIETRVVAQSPEIARGVDDGGAGDQGIVYGFATDATPEFLPAGFVMATALARGLERLREHGTIRGLRPDGKTQVTMDHGRPTVIVVSTQHDEDYALENLRDNLLYHLVQPIVGPLHGVNVMINPAGSWHVGGFAADTGLTGRKLMVDSCGGLVPHGGGASAGKDATKMDRSAKEFCRQVAIDLIRKGHGHEVLVSAAYAIAVPEAVMVTAKNEAGEDLSELAKKHYDFTPRAIKKGMRKAA